MNKLLNFLLLDIRLLAKSKVFYLKLILFPVVIILILGTMFKNSNSNITVFDVAFYSEDTAVSDQSSDLILGNTLRDTVLKSKDIKTLLNIKQVKSYAEGNNLVSTGKAAVFIYVPKNFTKSYIDGTKANITIIGDNNKQLDKSIVTNILSSFNESLDSINNEQKEIIKAFNSNVSVPQDKVQKIIDYIQTTSDSSISINKTATNNNAKPLDILQYEAIAMVVMFSILTAFELAHSIVDDKLHNTMFRIKSTPTLAYQYALGKVLGIVFAITIQMSIVMLISRIAFNVNWVNPIYIIITTVAYSFAIGAMVFTAGLYAKDHMSISSFATPILWGFSFLGGSFVSKYSFPDSLLLIQKLIPNGKAINSYLKICQGGSISDIYIDLLELVAIGIVFLIISLRLQTENGGDKNANNNTDKKSIEATV